jgi:putative component of membrane protein insertase Oxa1/YidC/SpoIIIJ protein YidD
MAKCHPWEHHNMELFGSHEEEKRREEEKRKHKAEQTPATIL